MMHDVQVSRNEQSHFLQHLEAKHVACPPRYVIHRIGISSPGRYSMQRGKRIMNLDSPALA